MSVQLMSDDAHEELDFDPLDATKVWPEEQFPLLPVGRLVLDRNPFNYFAEVEQVAFGTGVLVDGLDFSDDKLLQGRTFSYSDTQRHRVGSNYLQLPINRPKTHVGQCDRDIQERMVSHLSQCDEEYGHRLAERLGIQTGEMPSAESAARVKRDCGRARRVHSELGATRQPY
jgi:catalase